jgi:hypothetical protein
MLKVAKRVGEAVFNGSGITPIAMMQVMFDQMVIEWYADFACQTTRRVLIEKCGASPN